MDKDFLNIKKLTEKQLQSQLSERMISPKAEAIFQRGLFLPEKLAKKKLLFIGLNPSFRQNHAEIPGITYYPESAYGSANDYFSPFKMIATKTNMSWAHWDLLFFRQKSEKGVNDIIERDRIGKKHLENQLDLSKSVIEKAEPKIIVICSTKARGYFNNYMNYETIMDENLGTHKLIDTNSKLFGIPIFYSGMFSGSHPLDNGSKERLIWQINYVNKKKPSS